jgi:O-antigen/teichoic acid export membrane protein
MSDNNSLKVKATRGIIWNALEKLSVQGSQFIIGIVLARLLVPSDFGLMGMLTIFIVLSQTFVDSGMGSGLIQRQNRSEKDFSTVFIFNFGISAFFYLLLFITAPYISRFYNVPELVIITRVLGISLIINSFAIVQRSRLTISLDFKTLAKINITSIIISGIIAVYFAYTGFGVWSLVIRQILNSGISVILLWYFSRWKPSFVFSKQSFKNLFGYGSKLLAQGIYAQTLQNIYNITIGKYYSTSDLGYYTQAKQLVEITAGTISNILQQVTFPILSSLQDDKERMVLVYRRLIKMTSFFILPAMTILSLLSEPLILVFLGEKWRFAIPLLQWMSFARIFFPLSVLNMSILNAYGRSDLFLKVDLSKGPIIIIALIITIPISVKAIVIGHVITAFVAFFINAYLPGKLFGYGAMSQLKDIWPIFVTTTITAIFVYLVTVFIDVQLFKLILGGITALIVYLLVSYIAKIEALNEVIELFNNMKK